MSGTARPRPDANRPGIQKLALLAALAAGLIIPQWLIGGLVSEREYRQDEAQADIARQWGAAETLTGPIMLLPYQASVPNGPDKPRSHVLGTLMLMPQRLNADVTLDPSRRERGLFGATVYNADAKLEGEFVLPEITLPDHRDLQLDWSRASIMLGGSSLRGLTDAVPLQWNGAPILPADLPTSATLCRSNAALQWPVPFTAPARAGTRIPFRLALGFRGTQSLHLRGAAGTTRLRMAAPWGSPGFTGDTSPFRSEISKDAFSAEWQMSLQRPLLRQGGECPGGIEAVTERAGVTLIQPVQTYRMVERTAKYALLFVALGFMAYLGFEIATGLRIHLIQYGLLGCSLTLFPLLLLAIAEPFGFNIAYAAAAIAIIGQASLFTAGVTRGRLGAVFAGLLASEMGLIYMILQMESYALLAGAIALFLALSALMLLSRGVDWERAAPRDKPSPAS